MAVYLVRQCCCSEAAMLLWSEIETSWFARWMNSCGPRGCRDPGLGILVAASAMHACEQGGRDRLRPNGRAGVRAVDVTLVS